MSVSGMLLLAIVLLWICAWAKPKHVRVGPRRTSKESALSFIRLLASARQSTTQTCSGCALLSAHFRVARA